MATTKACGYDSVPRLAQRRADPNTAGSSAIVVDEETASTYDVANIPESMANMLAALKMEAPAAHALALFVTE